MFNFHVLLLTIGINDNQLGTFCHQDVNCQCFEECIYQQGSKWRHFYGVQSNILTNGQWPPDKSFTI